MIRKFSQRENFQMLTHKGGAAHHKGIWPLRIVMFLLVPPLLPK